jgi:hypothetical protein
MAMRRSGAWESSLLAVPENVRQRRRCRARFIWSLIRNVKGVLALNENKPIANPTSWLFG